MPSVQVASSTVTYWSWAGPHLRNSRPGGAAAAAAGGPLSALLLWHRGGSSTAGSAADASEEGTELLGEEELRSSSRGSLSSGRHQRRFSAADELGADDAAEAQRPAGDGAECLVVTAAAPGEAPPGGVAANAAEAGEGRLGLLLPPLPPTKLARQALDCT